MKCLVLNTCFLINVKNILIDVVFKTINNQMACMTGGNATFRAATSQAAHHAFIGQNSYKSLNKIPCLFPMISNSTAN